MEQVDRLNTAKKALFTVEDLDDSDQENGTFWPLNKARFGTEVLDNLKAVFDYELAPMAQELTIYEYSRELPLCPKHVF